jgi:hypothetical protein
MSLTAATWSKVDVDDPGRVAAGADSRVGGTCTADGAAVPATAADDVVAEGEDGAVATDTGGGAAVGAGSVIGAGVGGGVTGTAAIGGVGAGIGAGSARTIGAGAGTGSGRGSTRAG